MKRVMTFTICALLLLLSFTSAVAQDAMYGEAPMLAALVEAGELPPVEERLPAEPLVITPYERIGDYGGEWRSAMVGGLDHIWMIRLMAYENLIRFTPEWTGLMPGVAKSFSANDEATEFTFELREGLRWSDGAPYTADDITFWYDDVLTNEDLTPTIATWLISGGEPLSVEKIDDFTVKFSFSTPNGLFLQNLASILGCGPTSYPRHYLEPYHINYADDIDAKIAEAGASDWVELFQSKGGVEPCFWTNTSFWQSDTVPTLHAWRLTATYGGGTGRVEAERNPYYFKVDPDGNQLPYIDRMIFDQLEDKETLLLQVLNGDIDMMARHFNSAANRPIVYDNRETGGYYTYGIVGEGANMTALAINLTHLDPAKREIFQNKDFRIGLSHAINRQEIVDIVYLGQGEPRQIAPNPDSPFYDEEFAYQYTEYNVDLANEHLDKAGYTDRDAEGFRLGPDGNRISIIVEAGDLFGRGWPDVLELIQGYWGAVGIHMEPRIIDRSLLVSRKVNSEHDATIWGASGGLDVYLTPIWYFPSDPVESAYAPLWTKWYFDPETGEEPPEAAQQQMALFDQIKGTGDLERQAELMAELLAIAKDEFYVMGINSITPGYGIAKNYFRNVPATSTGSWKFPWPAPIDTTLFFIEEGAQQ
ncbi:MAG: ABC transporter substrate-binding protein [Chloroflexi bacterium]|nr:ABC transporter substrate-binding protein [Chloroflexota bacterium]